MFDRHDDNFETPPHDAVDLAFRLVLLFLLIFLIITGIAAGWELIFDWMVG